MPKGSTANPLAATQPGATTDAERMAELVEIVRAYNDVTARLEEAHEQLNGEVTRLQQELASANAALQRSRRLAALGEMAAGIAHEIRNPLASIQLYANMLTEDLASMPAQRDLAEKVAAAVRGLDGIVNDVLAFSREVKVQPRLCGVDALLGRAVETLGPMIEQSNIDIAIDCDEQMDLRCDAELIHQCLVNVVRNAIEAMPDGGRVSLEATAGEQAVTIIVRDTGPGIGDEAIDRIFNPFFTTRHTGTGLGLAIVHRIVDAHGGSIAVHNDGGAVLTIHLPARPPQRAEPQISTCEIEPVVAVNGDSQP